MFATELHTYSNGAPFYGVSFAAPAGIVLDAASNRGWEVREWRNAEGEPVGVVRPPKCKCWRAVGRFYRTPPGRSVIYRCVQPRG